MLRILLDFLPTVLGFIGFLVYRRYFAADAQKTARKSLSPKKEQNSEFEATTTTPVSEVGSEPEPGPEPEFSDESPLAKSLRAPTPPSPRKEGALDDLKPKLVQAKSGGKTSRRTKWGVAVIVLYLAVTVGVFMQWSEEPFGVKDIIASVSGAVQGKAEAEAEVKVKVNTTQLREDWDLPLWTESEKEAMQETAVKEDPVMTLALTRQFMTLRGPEGQVTYYKSAYWGSLTAGTPAMSFKVVFDTGSGHLILPSSYCHSATCKAHARYKRSQSFSAVDIDFDGSQVAKGAPRDQITVSFGTGEVTGIFVDDIMCVETIENLTSNATPDEVIPIPAEVIPAEDEVALAEVEQKEKLAPGCTRMRIVLATEMSEDPFKDFHFDGVLGLGLEGLSQTPEFNFPGVMERLVGDMGGAHPSIFSVFLARHKGETSELHLGGLAKNRQGGPLKWSPVVMPEHGHWMVSIKNIYVDGELLEFCQDGSCRAVADTGTSLLAVPSLAFPEIYEQLRHSPPASGECGDGPALQFELEGDDNFTISMRSEDYASLEKMKPNADPTRDWFRRFFFGQGWPFVQVPPEKPFRRDVFCKPLLMSMDLPVPLGPKLFILGEPLLRRYYAVYDTKNLAIGWARALHSQMPVEKVDEDSEEYWEDDLWEEEEELAQEGQN